MTKTYSQSAADVSRVWHEIDASDMALGRVATRIAQLLVGKDKPTYTPHIDGGDYVVVVNADKVVLSGRKAAERKYRHSGYPGGIKSTTLGEIQRQNPTRLIEEAVKGMLPKNKLQTARLLRLKVYAGPQHEHTAQKPVKVEVA